MGGQVSTIGIHGFLVDLQVTPITRQVTVSSSYTVPSGKNLYVTNSAVPSNMLVDGISINPSISFVYVPVIVSEGQVVSGAFYMNGYLRDQ